MDRREPPVAPKKVPIIGHLIGMRKYDIRYLEVLRCALSYPSHRNSPKLTQ